MKLEPIMRRHKTHISCVTHHIKRSRNLPVEFIREQVDDKDLSPNIISPPLQFSSETDRFVSSAENEQLKSQEDSLFVDAREALGELQKAVDSYNDGAQAKHGSLLAGGLQPSTWTDVKEVLASLQSQEEGKDDESRSAKTRFRRIAEAIPAFEGWLDLLPNGDYGAIVCGVFKVIVGAKKQANEVRLVVLEALSDIPDCVVRAATYREIYAQIKPRALTQRTAELCGAILIALRHVMDYFAEGTMKSALKAMGQGSEYKKKLLQQLDRVNKLATKIDTEANISAQQRLKNMEEMNYKMMDMITNLKQQSSCEATEEAAKSIATTIAKMVLNGLHSHLSSNPELLYGIKSEHPTSLESFDPSLDSASSSTQGIDPNVILSALRFSPDVPSQDLQLCLRKGHNLDLAGQDRVKWIMKARGFHNWLNSPVSRTLLINGSIPGAETFSPVTLLSAKLIESLRALSPVITLHYFCSVQNRFEKDTKDNAIGLLESLIGQLLTYPMPWDTTFLSSADQKRLEEDDFNTACMLFRRLIQQVPRTTFMFWVVDNIGFYERVERRRDFVRLVDELLGVMHESDNIIVKLLLTCHSRSFFVMRSIPKEDILYLPQGIDGGRQGLSDYAWQRAIAGEIEGLNSSPGEDNDD